MSRFSLFILCTVNIHIQQIQYYNGCTAIKELLFPWDSKAHLTVEQLWVSALVETRRHGHVPRLSGQRLPEDVQPLGSRHAHHWSGEPPMSPGGAVTLTRALTSVCCVLRPQRQMVDVGKSLTYSLLFSSHTRHERDTEKNESLEMFSSRYCVTSSLKLENYSRARKFEKREWGSPTSSWYFHLLFSTAFSPLRCAELFTFPCSQSETSQAVTKHLHLILKQYSKNPWVMEWMLFFNS